MTSVDGKLFRIFSSNIIFFIYKNNGMQMEAQLDEKGAIIPWRT